MGLVSPKDVENFTKEKFPEYSKEEKEMLKKVYSPEQIKALEAGEAAIDPNDLTVQGRLRRDPYKLPYIDDFRDIQPVVDRRPRNKSPPDSNAKFMNLDEFTDDMIKWASESEGTAKKGPVKKLEDFIPAGFKGMPEAKWPSEARQVAAERYTKYLEAQAKEAEEGGPNRHEFFDYLLNRSSMTDDNLQSNSLLAPALPNKVPGVAGLYNNPIDPEDEGLDDTGAYKDLKRKTGMSVKEILNTRVKILVQRSVSNQTRLGKIRSWSVLAVAGNKDGWLGLGMAKSTEPTIATDKAKQLAIRNMQPIPRYENRTIYGNVEGKSGGTIVQLFSRPPGSSIPPPLIRIRRVVKLT